MIKKFYYWIISKEKLFANPVVQLLGFYPFWLFDTNQERRKLLRSVRSHTMVSYKKLKNVYNLAGLIEKENIQGAFVECGVWKGGCSAIMAYFAKRNKRKVYLFDSFEGLPEPTFKDGKMARIYSGNRSKGKLRSISKNVASVEDVEEILFNNLRLSGDNINIVKGWFQDTLPKKRKEVGDISLLRLDGDWYESTRVCLENLYDQVVDGGYVIIDDYGFWSGCKKAVDEFLEKRRMKPKIIKVDYSGVYFKKE